MDNSYTTNAEQRRGCAAVFLERNPWAEIAIDNEALVLGGWLSEQLVEHLNGTTYGVVDPRLAEVAGPHGKRGPCGHAERRGKCGLPRATPLQKCQTYI